MGVGSDKGFTIGHRILLYTTYISRRQKYFKHKLQSRSAYHTILDQNESTKIFFGHFGGLVMTRFICLACLG